MYVVYNKSGFGVNANYGVLTGFMEYYLSTRRWHPLTVALRAGGATTHGDVPWYELPTLGADSGLRGYFKNRWAGTSSAYLNGELRYQLLERTEGFIPIKVGVKAFYDYGRVFQKNREESGDWRSGYGFGFYLVPLNEALTVSISVSFSDEESVYPAFSIGAPLR